MLLAGMTGTVQGAVQGTVSTQHTFTGHPLWTEYFPRHFSCKFSFPHGDHILGGEAKTHKEEPE